MLLPTISGALANHVLCLPRTQGYLVSYGLPWPVSLLLGELYVVLRWSVLRRAWALTSPDQLGSPLVSFFISQLSGIILPCALTARRLLSQKQTMQRKGQQTCAEKLGDEGGTQRGSPEPSSAGSDSLTSQTRYQPVRAPAAPQGQVARQGFLVPATSTAVAAPARQRPGCGVRYESVLGDRMTVSARTHSWHPTARLNFAARRLLPSPSVSC